MFNKLKKLISHRASSSETPHNIAKEAGDECLKTGQIEKAITHYRQAISNNPEFWDAHIALGFACSEKRLFDEANQHLQLALSANAHNADIVFILGNISESQGDEPAAIEYFYRTIEIDAGFVYAYHKLLNIFLSAQNLQQAEEIAEKAIAAFPGSTEFYFKLAEICFHQKDYGKAIAPLRKILSISPNDIDCLTHLAAALSETGAYEEGITYYTRALSLDPENQAATKGLGENLHYLGKHKQAIPYLEKASKGSTENASIHHLLGNASLSIGDKNKALTHFREVLRIEPTSPLAHLVDALSGLTTKTAPKGYVEQLFDGYAKTFDSALVESLRYDTPTILVSLINACRKLEGKKLHTLDLGCGTGLFGKAISPYSEQIVGVDLSAKMLDKARDKNIYHRLEQMDLLEMMQNEKRASYDLITASDVFVYIGELDKLIEEAKRLLRPNGILAFSVESLETIHQTKAHNENIDFSLSATGRYSHSINYLNRLAKSNNFQIMHTQEQQIRLDYGKPIIGYLTAWFA